MPLFMVRLRKQTNRQTGTHTQTKMLGVGSKFEFVFTVVALVRCTCFSTVMAGQITRRSYHRNTGRSEPESHRSIQEYGRQMHNRHYGMWTVNHVSDIVQLLDSTRVMFFVDQ